MVFGDKNTFAIEIEHVCSDLDPHSAATWGSCYYWIADVRLGDSRDRIDHLGIFACFLDDVLERRFSLHKSLVSLEPHEKALAVYRNVYGETSAEPDGEFQHYVLAPAGHPSFGGFYVFCFDENSDALLVAVKPDYSGDLYWDELAPSDIVSVRVPSPLRDGIFTAARDWIHALR